MSNVALEAEGLGATVVFYEGILRATLRSPLAADLARRGIAVQTAAKRIASERSPSAPGMGPGVVTGRLRSSIDWQLGEDGLSPYVDIGSAVLYAPYLELGTSKMAARPFLRPALLAAGGADV